MNRWLSKLFSPSHLSRPRTTRAKQRQRPLVLERLEDRTVPTLMISLQEPGFDGGAGVGNPVVEMTSSDFTATSFTGTYGDFKVTFFGASSDNGATKSDLLSATTSVQNIGLSTATLNLIVFQNDYTLPAGSPLVVESGMGGSMNAGTTLSPTNIFQAFASSTNNTTFDFTNGPQTATQNVSTFDTGSTTGLFSPTVGNLQQHPSTASINLNAGGKINFSSHVNVGPGPAIEIVKLTNGTNNDSPPVAGTPDGPIVPVGSTVTWTYNVTDNGSNVLPLSNITVADNIAGVNPTPVTKAGNSSATPTTTVCSKPAKPGSSRPPARPPPVSTATSARPGTTPTGGIVMANNPGHYFERRPSRSSS